MYYHYNNSFIVCQWNFKCITYNIYREYFMNPIDETAAINSPLLNEYKVLQVRQVIIFLKNIQSFIH